ncbi:hypothetical protein [Granulicella sibirica]|uniref:Uncharacterized protein n=1 Tax=Granulicella sibirica TaxID=2479048 RepID=A0A4Q0SXF9_9BACT|nr:hypothetical protein [Granulicella sibirica]RXH54670.1 hypothetical protein GRAN_3774 [Granulicella sibirica]
MSVPNDAINAEKPIQPRKDTDELNDKQLDEVSGGLNPQPEPPGRHFKH